MTDLANTAAHGGDGLTGVLKRISDRRKEIAQDSELVLQVPCYEGDLWIRYRAIPLDELNKFLERAAKSSGKQLIETNADLIIRCCDEILVKQREGLPLEPIDKTAATTFSTGTLPDLLDFQAETAREEVFGLFSPDGAHPMACGLHSDAISAWLQGKGAEIDETLLGE